MIFTTTYASNPMKSVFMLKVRIAELLLDYRNMGKDERDAKKFLDDVKETVGEFISLNKLTVTVISPFGLNGHEYEMKYGIDFLDEIVDLILKEEQEEHMGGDFPLNFLLKVDELLGKSKFYPSLMLG